MKTFSSKSFGNFRTASFTDFPRTDSYAFLEVFFNDEGLEGLSNEPLDSIGLCMDEGDNSPNEAQGNGGGPISSSSGILKRSLEKAGGGNNMDGSDQHQQQHGPQAKRMAGHITFATPVPPPENGSQSQGNQPQGPFSQPLSYYQPFKPFPPQMAQALNPSPQFTNQQPFSSGGEAGGEQQQQQQQQQEQHNSQGGAVHVSSASRCPFCPELNVDTQLRPCGHLFHGHCLKPWVQECAGTPLCPVCNVPISSCVLAIPCIYPGGGMASAPPPPQQQQHGRQSHHQQQPPSITRNNGQHQQMVAKIKPEQIPSTTSSNCRFYA